MTSGRDLATRADELATRLLAEVTPPWLGEAALRPEASLRRDLGLDSLARMVFAERVAEDCGADPLDVAALIAGVETVADARRVVHDVLAAAEEGA